MSRTWTRGLTVASVLLVSTVAAVVSYAHMQTLASLHGEGWRSLIIPLSVDGMLVAATLAIVDRRRASQPAGWVPWLGVTLGLLASLAANVAAAQPELIAQLIAGWPPVALAVSIETLVIVLRNTTAVDTVTESAPAVSSTEQVALVMTLANLAAKAPASATLSRRSENGTPPPSPTDPKPRKPAAKPRKPRRLVAPARPPATVGDLAARRAAVGEATHPAVNPPTSPAGEIPVIPPTSPAGDRVGELLAAGAGRRAISRELNISEHAARELLARGRNGSTPS